MLGRSERWATWLPVAWSCLLAALLLGPALAPGYVLSYDMVWVPDLTLRSDFLGLATSLPRVVPSDAVVAVIDSVIPGMVLQKIVLLGSLVAGGIGAARLVMGLPMVGRLAVVTGYLWSPLVVERLLIGHWPVVIGWACLPWVLTLTHRWRSSGMLPAALPLVVVIGSLSASAGVVTAFALVVGSWNVAPSAGRWQQGWPSRPMRPGWSPDCSTRGRPPRRLRERRPSRSRPRATYLPRLRHCRWAGSGTGTWCRPRGRGSPGG